jgi:hypothetical protein
VTAYIAAAARLAFDSQTKVAAFGADYVRCPTPDGGDLWLTKWGLPYRDHLMPDRWFHEGSCAKFGQRLGFSTGHVYRLSVTVANRRLSFVAKVSRMAQRVESHGLDQAIEGSRISFPSPFEEFGQLIALRASSAPAGYLFTKRPLGIFSPGEPIPSWMLDRVPHAFNLIARRHAADAAGRGEPQTIFLEPNREYYTLFAWIEGFNLEELVAMGRISRSELAVLNRQVRERLTQAGFAVADHKPDHVIVRLDKTGVPRHRNGRLVAALADFELLEPAPRRVSSSSSESESSVAPLEHAQGLIFTLLTQKS